MVVATEDFAAWLAQADIPATRRTPQLDALLQTVFHFRQQPAPLIAAVPTTAPAAVIELARSIEPNKPSAPPFCSDGHNTLAPSC